MWIYQFARLLRSFIKVLDFNKSIFLHIFFIITVSYCLVLLIVCYIASILLWVVTIDIILTFKNIILIFHNLTVLCCVLTKVLKFFLLMFILHINAINCLLPRLLSHRLIVHLPARCICGSWFIHKLKLFLLPFDNSSVTLHSII